MTDVVSIDVPPRTGGRRRALVVILIILLIAAGGFLVWREKFETYHLATVQEGVLYRDGNRNVREFANAVERVNARTVVVLVDDGEIANPKKPEFGDELKYLSEQGIKVERIPVKLGGWPTSDDVRRFLSVVSDKQNHPVLVHCAQGVRRTGMMVAAYQEAVLGYDDAKARQSILTFGHSQRTVKDVERFIEGYDPKTEAVPQGLEPSAE
jgi:protein tyrosine phosphatase (PTP) superfamily phosphohydrolase (DUF442 family)